MIGDDHFDETVDDDLVKGAVAAMRVAEPKSVKAVRARVRSAGSDAIHGKPFFEQDTETMEASCRDDSLWLAQLIRRAELRPNDYEATRDAVLGHPVAKAAYEKHEVRRHVTAAAERRATPSDALLLQHGLVHIADAQRSLEHAADRIRQVYERAGSPPEQAAERPKSERELIADAIEAWARLGASQPSEWAGRIRRGDYRSAYDDGTPMPPLTCHSCANGSPPGPDHALRCPSWSGLAHNLRAKFIEIVTCRNDGERVCSYAVTAGEVSVQELFEMLEEHGHLAEPWPPTRRKVEVVDGLFVAERPPETEREEIERSAFEDARRLRAALVHVRGSLAHEENELDVFVEASEPDDHTADLAEVASVAIHNVIVEIDKVLSECPEGKRET